MTRPMTILLLLSAFLLGGCALIKSRFEADHALIFNCEELGAHLYDYAPEGFERADDAGQSNAGETAVAGAPATPVQPASILSPQWRADAAYVENLVTPGTATDAANSANADDPMLAAMTGLSSESLVESSGSVPPSNVLLLSGGGQWGAFGAGFLSELHLQGQMPRLTAINGISTGAMQSLYIAAGRAEDYTALRHDYQLAATDYSQPESTVGTLLNGRKASLAPLRSLLETRLCPNGIGAACTLIDAIRTSPSQLFIGMVAAESGRFHYVDVQGLLRDIKAHHDDADANRRAQQCVTGVALASSSIPVMLQRVRMNYRLRGAPSAWRSDIFYDGGTRYSVFDATIAHRADIATTARAQFTEMRRRQRLGPQYDNGPAPVIIHPVALATSTSAVDGAERATSPSDVQLYIIRNGPLAPIANSDINRDGSILAAAMRGYAILVNQSEIISIRAMRIYRPTGQIRYITADNYVQDDECRTQYQRSREDDVAFSQPFMQCLVRLGTDAARSNSWRDMPPIRP